MRFDTIWLDARLATLDARPPGLGVVERGAVAATDGRIAFAGADGGAADRLGRGASASSSTAAGSRPGLIDCHTHLVYAGDRAHEFELRLAGRLLRGDRARRRRHRLDREGDARRERGRARRRKRCRGSTRCSPKASPRSRSSRATASIARARRKHAARRAPARPRARRRRGHDASSARTRCRRRRCATRTRFIDEVCAMIPAARAATGSPTRSTRSAKASRSRPSRPRACSPPRRPPACRSSCMPTSSPTCTARGSPPSTARCRPIISNTPTRTASPRWRSAGTVAVLLPGAFYVLREKQLPPVEAFRRHRRADRDRDRLQSRHLADHLAAADHEHGGDAVPPHGRGGIAGVTREAARALGRLSDIGTLEAGKRCDLAIWDIERPAELVYRIGFNPLHARVWRGDDGRDPDARRRVPLAAWRAHRARRGVQRSIRPRCRRSRRAPRAVDAIVAEGEPVYGINTGFGKLASVRIADRRSRTAAAQHRALACGRRRRADAGRDRAADDGAEAREPRRAARPACGRATLAASCRRCSTRGVIPVVPSQGSVGASGDLAPLAHMTAAMLGVGEAFYRRRAHAGRLPRSRAPDSTPLVLGAEGRARAAQRHAVLDRAGARRRCSRSSACSRPRSITGALVDRCGARAPTRRSIRASRRCAAIAARSRSRPRCAR